MEKSRAPVDAVEGERNWHQGALIRLMIETLEVVAEESSHLQQIQLAGAVQPGTINSQPMPLFFGRHNIYSTGCFSCPNIRKESFQCSLVPVDCKQSNRDTPDETHIRHSLEHSHGHYKQEGLKLATLVDLEGFEVVSRLKHCIHPMMEKVQSRRVGVEFLVLSFSFYLVPHHVMNSGSENHSDILDIDDLYLTSLSFSTIFGRLLILTYSVRLHCHLS